MTVTVCVCGMSVLMVFDVALIAVVIKHESLRGRDPKLNVNKTTHTHNYDTVNNDKLFVLGHRPQVTFDSPTHSLSPLAGCAAYRCLMFQRCPL